jgi:hypothetical protein
MSITESEARQSIELQRGLTSAPVWLCIAEEAASTPAVAFLVHATLRDWASQERVSEPDDYLFDLRDIACFCGVDIDEIVRVTDLIFARGLADHDLYYSLKNRREFRQNVAATAAKSPTAHALRQRRYRARLRAGSAATTASAQGEAPGEAAAASPGAIENAAADSARQPGVTPLDSPPRPEERRAPL